LNILFITVGTSALTNDVGRAPDDRDNGALKTEIQRYFAAPQKDEQRWSRLRSDLIDAHSRYWQADARYTNDPRHFLYTSAELTSTVFLVRSLQAKEPANAPERLVLLSSDTPEGWLAAGVNESVLRELFSKLTVERRKVSGLDVRFRDTQTALNTVFDEYRLQANDHVIINITGGFKGTIPFLTHFARTHAWELYFQHESQDSAVLLPFEKNGEPGEVKEYEPWRD
jgi:putative CRISPR-associated protein (TIGR02619 family)